LAISQVGKATTVEYRFSGTFFIAFSPGELGNLNHDGSIGHDVPIEATAVFDIPVNPTINFLSDRRTIDIPDAVQFDFLWGNYSVSAKIPLFVYQLYPPSDLLIFSLRYDLDPATFSGSLFEGTTLITDFTRFINSRIAFTFWYQDIGATLENVWQNPNPNLKSSTGGRLGVDFQLDDGLTPLSHVGALVITGGGNPTPTVDSPGWSITVDGNLNLLAIHWVDSLIPRIPFDPEEVFNHSLISILNVTKRTLEDVSEQNDHAAYNSLGAFSSLVDAQAGIMIDEDDAYFLINEAQHIQRLILIPEPEPPVIGR
jgi:hypothetical protein